MEEIHQNQKPTLQEGGGQGERKRESVFASKIKYPMVGQSDKLAERPCRTDGL